MSKRNAHDFRCAQEVVWLNRDSDFPDPEVRAPFVKGLVRRRGETTTRISAVPKRPIPTAAEVRGELGLLRR